MSLELSDLFVKRGKSFEWTDRIDDQNRLIKRLKDLEDSDLSELAEDLEEFTNGGIASVVYIEYLLEKVTKLCSQKNISIS